MLKQIMVFCLFLSMVSSCKCNKGNESSSTVTSTDTMTAPQSTTTDGTATNTGTDSAAMTAAGSANADNNSSTGSTTKGQSLYRKGRERANTGGSKGYFPEGSDRLLTEKDLDYLTEWGLAMMKNEIYARNGMIFPDGMLKDHFEAQPWYHGTSTNVKGKLSSIEKSNLYFIANYKYVPDAKNYNSAGTAVK